MDKEKAKLDPPEHPDLNQSAFAEERTAIPPPTATAAAAMHAGNASSLALAYFGNGLNGSEPRLSGLGERLLPRWPNGSLVSCVNGLPLDGHCECFPGAAPHRALHTLNLPNLPTQPTQDSRGARAATSSAATPAAPRRSTCACSACASASPATWAQSAWPCSSTVHVDARGTARALQGAADATMGTQGQIARCAPPRPARCPYPRPQPIPSSPAHDAGSNC